MGRTAASEDPISGLLIALDSDIGAYPTEMDNVGALYLYKLTFFEQLATALGIETTDTTDLTGAALTEAQAKNAIVYHVDEFFRMSPTGTLYLALAETDMIGGDAVETLQNYAEGKIRQVGIITANDANVGAYQASATALEAQHKPLSIVYTTKGIQTLASLTATNAHIVSGRSNVSKLIGCDLYPGLIQEVGETYGYSGCIGTLLGALSAAAVNESIAWVQKFPLDLTLPGLISGDLIKEVSTGNQTLLNDNRYIFVRTHTGEANNYFNDSHTYDVVTSDYAYIENVRTMDKATRGIRKNLLPYLNAPLYVDAETGKMRADTVAVLETTAGRALEDMEKAGELSGYRVEIDPEQNVLATSEVEVIIRNVPVGVMRRVTVKIGFTTKLN